MTIASALTAMNTDIVNARTAITTKGGTVTSGGGSSQLATDIATIPTGSSPVITSLNVTPTTSAQTITAPSGTDGYSPVNVAAVTAAIDSDIKASNIKSGVSILDVTGNVVELNGETRTATLTSSAGNTFTPSSGKNAITSITVTPNNQARSVTPSTSSQTLSVNSGYSGNGTITVNPVTASIDANITAGNIKKDVQILGVTGTYEGGSNFVGIPREITSQGVFQIPHTTSYTYTLPEDAVDIGNYCFANAFYGSFYITSASFPKLTTISGSSAFENAFRGCSGLTSASFPKLTTISGSSSFYYAFTFCTGLTSMSFPKLTTIGGSGFSNAFRGCSNLAHIYFNALTTLRSNSFASMINGVTGCTIHFPSNLQSTISGLSGYPNFGGTNTVLSFDLPATS